MTTIASDTFAAPARSSLRWSAAFIAASILHVLLVAAVIRIAQQAEPEDGGLIMMDLPPLAVESTSTEADNAENAQDETTAPPPSDASETEPPPPEPEPVPEAEPEQPEAVEPPATPVETPPEITPEPVEEPPVPEAVKAPEPEVVLPKPVEKKTPRPVEKPEPKTPEPKRRTPEKKAEQKPAAELSGKKTGVKSNSKAASAAAAGGGKFSPNAISRPQPPYPAAARASRTEGYVVVRYTVSPSGAVTGVSVVSASPAGVFNGVTVSAVRRWRFRPSASGGSGTTTIRFKLR